MRKKIKNTKLVRSNHSVITTIPKTILELENISISDEVSWSYEIIDNKIIYNIEFVKN